jgi:ATP-dependent exoDNAse (exonuclease V) beta subunit
MNQLGHNFYSIQVVLSNLLQASTELEEKDYIAIIDEAMTKSLPLIEDILFDEFQDISYLQMKFLRYLIKKSTSIFSILLVGDPMQSIYSFRQSEINCFLSVWKEKRIGDIQITPLSLQSNFRSSKNIVDFINKIGKNRTHSEVFQNVEKVEIITEAIEGELVQFLYHEKVEQTCNKVMKFIEEYQIIHQQDTIALLVRERSHAKDIQLVLSEKKVVFSNFIYQPSQERSIRFLIIIYSLLSNNHNIRVWLILLKEYFSFVLEDFLLLCTKKTEVFIENLKESDPVLNKIILLIQSNLPYYHILSLCYQEVICSDLEKFNFFWNSFSLHIEDKIPLEINVMNNIINQFSIPRKMTNLNLMTIHQSKGLEFDCIILLEAQKPFYNKISEPILFGLIGDYPYFTIKGDTQYEYYKQLEKERLFLEQERLLYVALTRAKKKLVISYTTREENKKGYNFLSMLY